MEPTQREANNNMLDVNDYLNKVSH